ncbi:MAG: Rieske (2Fe-2S) protein [Gammaproteobacteria bacterium]
MHPLCKTADLKDGALLECRGPDGGAVVVACCGGEYFAAEGECPHQAAPLADGEIGEDENGKCTLTCCLHFWTWRLADGAPLEDAEEPLKVYPVKVEDGTVYLA